MCVGVVGVALHVPCVSVRAGDGRLELREGEESKNAGQEAEVPPPGARGSHHPSGEP